MHKTRYFSFTICVALLAATVATPARAADEASEAKEKERQLIDVLTADSPKADKAITCKRLAIYGTKNAVPALAALLPDEQLTSWARIALEAIPGPEADQALREAMGKLDGRVLIGVINSIGVRRDAAAVDGLVGRLTDADADVASAAAVALGRIADAPATKALEQSLAGAPATVRSAVAEGCILCAEKLLADGKTAEAAKLYDAVRKADVPKQRVIEATRGSILASGSAGVPLLVEQLRSPDKAMFRLGLTVSRELASREVTEAIAAELSKVTPARQVLLVTALADRNDDAVLPAVLEAARSGPPAVRIAAVVALSRAGDVSSVPVLLDVATLGDAQLTEAAVAALEGLPGKDVDADLAARLRQAKGAARGVLIQLAGRRRIEAATPALLEAADDPSSLIRAAALTALGETIGPDDLAVLIKRVTAPRKREDVSVAALALRAACIRMPDGEACAAQLATAMSRASVPTKCTLLEILGAMGGPKALATLGSAARSKTPELQDTASRLLGEWMTIDAAPVLLDLSKTAPGEKYQIRALRGYIRLVRQFTVPDPQRTEMCRAALKAAERDDEKKLVLEVMERYPSLDMLRLAVETAKSPSLKTEAAAVSLIIAQKIGGSSVDVLKLLSLDPMKIEIVKAEYGAGTKIKDVTAVLRQRARDLPLIILSSSSYNSAFGGDPASGVVKRLKVQYRINGKAGEASFAEDAPIMLPVPK